MNKKIIFWMVVVVLLSSLVAADLKDTLGDVRDKFGDVEGAYDNNPQLWDFLLFTVIFALVAWLGLSAVFKEQKGATLGIAFALGLVFGFAALKAGLSMEFLIPFVKNAFFFIIALLIFFLFVKMEFPKNKLVAFLLALLITFLMFNFFGLFKGEKLFDNKEIDEDFTLDQIHGELDALAVEYDVNQAAWDKADKEETEAKRLQEKVKLLRSAIDSALKLENNEDTIDAIKKDKKYVNQLNTAGKQLVSAVDRNLKELGELERDIDALDDKVDKKTIKKADAQKEFDNLQERLDDIKERNEEI